MKKKKFKIGGFTGEDMAIALAFGLGAWMVAGMIGLGLMLLIITGIYMMGS